MSKRDRIRHAVLRAVEEVNQQLPVTERLGSDLETPIFGGDGKLDSLALVNLVVAAETQISQEFARPIVLADERAFSRRNSPFRTISSLVDYAHEILGEGSRD